MSGALTPQDPADRILRRMIGASGTPYNTPSLEAVDLHIDAVQRRLAWLAQHQPPHAADALRQDLRMLLARREWMVIAEDADRPQQ